MKHSFILLTTLVVAFLVVSKGDALAACEYQSWIICSPGPFNQCLPTQSGSYEKKTPIPESECIAAMPALNGQTCPEALGPSQRCIKGEMWSADCGGCTTTSPRSCAGDAGGTCVGTGVCDPGYVIPGTGSWSDCGIGSLVNEPICCSYLPSDPSKTCQEDYGGFCYPSCGGDSVPLPPGQTSWPDCTGAWPDCCDSNKLKSCEEDSGGQARCSPVCAGGILWGAYDCGLSGEFCCRLAALEGYCSTPEGGNGICMGESLCTTQEGTCVERPDFPYFWNDCDECCCQGVTPTPAPQPTLCTQNSGVCLLAAQCDPLKMPQCQLGSDETDSCVEVYGDGQVCCKTNCTDYCYSRFGECVSTGTCPAERFIGQPAWGWLDCTGGEECCQQETPPAGSSCYQQCAVCKPKGRCDFPVPSPSGGWVDCSLNEVCCRSDQSDFGCERAKDPNRGKVACGRFFLKKTKEWDSTYTTRAAAEAAKDAIDFIEPLFDFTGIITIGKKDKDTEGEFTWPIKGDLPRLAGYFPDYQNADDTYNSPPVIEGASDLANYNFVPGALLLYGPPGSRDALAAWLPTLYNTYGHYTVPIEYCINSRLPGDPGTDKDGNPEMHGAVRYTYGLWKAMHNYETETGIWDWIARTPGLTEKDVINWAKSLASTETAPQSIAQAEEILPPSTRSQDDTSQQTTTISIEKSGLVLGANTTNVPCGYSACERDARSAPEYDEGCVWFGGEAHIAGGVRDVRITNNNSDPKITYDNDPINPVYTLSYSHTVAVGPIKIDVNEGYLDNYWPLKLNFFLNLIPEAAQEDYIFNPPKEVGCKDSCENSWGNVDLYHSGGIEIVSADAADDGGGNLEYLHTSGWAETAEELVMGKQSEGVLGAKTSEAEEGDVLSAAVGGPGFAIPPSWAELYLPIIIRPWEE